MLVTHTSQPLLKLLTKVNSIDFGESIPIADAGETKYPSQHCLEVVHEQKHKVRKSSFNTPMTLSTKLAAKVVNPLQQLHRVWGRWLHNDNAQAYNYLPGFLATSHIPRHNNWKQNVYQAIVNSPCTTALSVDFSCSRRKQG
jgi:hypothetical protein